MAEPATTKLPEGCTTCPACNASWQDGDIFEKLQIERNAGRAYLGKTDEQLKEIAGQYGWSEENKKQFSRLLGIQYAYGHPKHYDGVSAWQCPDCATRWDRF